MLIKNAGPKGRHVLLSVTMLQISKNVKAKVNVNTGQTATFSATPQTWPKQIKEDGNILLFAIEIEDCGFSSF